MAVALLYDGPGQVRGAVLCGAQACPAAYGIKKYVSGLEDDKLLLVKREICSWSLSYKNVS